jgi:hypothetical protein
MSVSATLQQAMERVKADAQPLSSQEIEEAGRNDWNRVSVNFGIVAPSTNQDYSFTYLGTDKIESVTSSCGCTSSTNDNNKVHGVWTIPADFSYSQDKLITSSKTVKVTFKSGNTQTLTLSAVIDKTL